MQINHFVEDENGGGTTSRSSKAVLLLAAACGLVAITDSYRATAMQLSTATVAPVAVAVPTAVIDRTVERNVLHHARTTAFPPSQDAGLGFLALLAAASSAAPGR